MIKGKNIGAFHTRSTARSDTLAYAWRSQKRGKIHHPGRSPVESSDRREGGSADSSEAASHAGSVAAVSAGGKGGEWNGVPADKWHFTKIGRGTRLNSSHLGISYAVFCL